MKKKLLRFFTLCCWIVIWITFIVILGKVLEHLESIERYIPEVSMLAISLMCGIYLIKENRKKKAEEEEIAFFPKARANTLNKQPTFRKGDLEAAINYMIYRVNLEFSKETKVYIRRGEEQVDPPMLFTYTYFFDVFWNNLSNEFLNNVSEICISTKLYDLTKCRHILHNIRLEKLTHLEKIEVYNLPLEEKELIKISSSKNLIELKLTSAKIDWDNLDVLFTHSKISALEKLDLSNNNINYINKFILPFSITELNLSDNYLFDESIENLLGSPLKNNLVELNISGNLLTEYGVNLILRSEMEKLEVLNIRSNKIKNNDFWLGVGKEYSLLNLKKLTANKISSIAVADKILSLFPNLEEIKYTYDTPEEVETFLNEMLKAKIR